MHENTWKHCKRCGNVLMGNEQRGETCNRCLDLGYESMTDEEYDAKMEADIDRVLRPTWAKSNARIYGITATLALALSLIPLTTNASTPTWDHPVFPTDAYLSGCEVRQSVDDGTRIAECPEDGAVYVWDADGQVWINDAGTPLRAPHNWYVVK